MADREFSTVAHEFDNNPALLNSTREEFIAKKVREQHVQPPYFRNMEKLNLEGVEHWPVQRNYINQQTLQEYSEAPNRVLVDIRSTEAYLAGHIPGSI
ncbi:MAG: rhodanese-like domain-containing protein, partial [Gammaproteobacteria bacterium]|nr:rhodanese-like domain-containing protein [Gammaproteobacteria bacterium]NIR95784.1 rhodanese-like domain-containing protein [Gammaproteobacteria bacterium]